MTNQEQKVKIGEDEYLAEVYLNAHCAMVRVPEGIFGKSPKIYRVRTESNHRYHTVLVEDETPYGLVDPSKPRENPIFSIDHRGPHVGSVKYAMEDPKRGLTEAEKQELAILRRALEQIKPNVNFDEVDKVLSGGVRNLL